MVEFVERPTPYPREPFQLASGELVAFEGRFYSAPAYALLLDMRLMSQGAVTNPFKLYINKDAGLSNTIEPRLDASGYETATPHYDDYICDMRDALDFVVARHAADSDHLAILFKAAHLRRQHIPYNLDNTSASGTSDGDYVHPTPAAIVPTGNELGAQYIQDIDLDEVMWQPFTRPKNQKLGPASIPVEPIFPAVLNGGSLPTFSALDTQMYDDLGYGASSSGGLVVTGDRLLAGSSVKLLTGSGQTGVSEGSFRQAVPAAQFPIGTGLGQFYGDDAPNGDVQSTGRQGIYNVPAGLPGDSVLMLDVSDASSSGLVIQTYPGNYYATSGVNSTGKVHNGVHNTNKLLYNINGLGAGLPNAGRSTINGSIIFGHFGGTETGSEGQTINALTYANGNTIYGYGGVIDPRVGISVNSTFEWYTTGKTFSPLSWDILTTSALGPAIVPFSSPFIEYTTHDVADINVSDDDGVITRKVYSAWGFIDQVVCPDQDRAQGGQLITSIITYTTYTYNENGMGGWVLQPGSPTTSTQSTLHLNNTYNVGNIFSFFFFRRARRNHGMVNVNGNMYHQWSESNEPVHKFMSMVAGRQTQLVPPTSRSSSINSIGFFPSWKLVLTITTNNQVVKPTEMFLSPGSSKLIGFNSQFPFAISDVDTFGPVVWDSNAGLNYLYFNTKDTAPGGEKVYFAKMDTNFEICHINEVNSADAILGGRMALLSI